MLPNVRWCIVILWQHTAISAACVGPPKEHRWTAAVVLPCRIIRHEPLSYWLTRCQMPLCSRLRIRFARFTVKNRCKMASYIVMLIVGLRQRDSHLTNNVSLATLLLCDAFLWCFSGDAILAMLPLQNHSGFVALLMLFLHCVTLCVISLTNRKLRC